MTIHRNHYVFMMLEAVSLKTMILRRLVKSLKICLERKNVADVVKSGENEDDFQNYPNRSVWAYRMRQEM